jgi:hypothetical protein
MVNGNQKGKRGERDARDHVTEVLGLDKGQVYRSQQYCGKGGDSADIVGIPGVHMEVKRTEKLNLYKALDQAISDSKENNIPIVLHRKNRREWVVIVRLTDIPKLTTTLSGKKTNETRPKRVPLADRIHTTQ